MADNGDDARPVARVEAEPRATPLLFAALLLFSGGIVRAMTEEPGTFSSWPAAILVVLGSLCATIFLVVNEPSFQ
jgi:hypothetical protein